ncbi:hypothetical protein [Pseudonocardia zijingensis]|uniref:Uncharacterized protein n=1 Tax=Pseudonocardia zijingensis TaxID=153376 RepID=A0ABN1N9F5_9PSEU
MSQPHRRFGRTRRFSRTGVYHTRENEWVAFYLPPNGYGGREHPPRATRAEAEADLQKEYQYWHDLIAQVEANPNRYVVIDGTCYGIGPEEGVQLLRNSPKRWRGFEGREFRIRRQDGTEVVIHNLWLIGLVPAEVRHRLPDNARWVPRYGR